MRRRHFLLPAAAVCLAVTGPAFAQGQDRDRDQMMIEQDDRLREIERLRERLHLLEEEHDLMRERMRLQDRRHETMIETLRRRERERDRVHEPAWDREREPQRGGSGSGGDGRNGAGGGRN
ncbi:MAG: hypothetical protein ACQEUZ_16495 [Pseudomonadota bacterium]